MGWLLLASATFAATPGDPWLNSDELGRYCLALEDGSVAADGTICIAYLQGFIAGTTLLQDAGVGEDETFAERAIRTRAAPYVRRVESGRDGAYCLGDDVTPSAVLEAINERLEAGPEDSEVTAHDIVHEALIQRFPCEER